MASSGNEWYWQSSGREDSIEKYLQTVHPSAVLSYNKKRVELITELLQSLSLRGFVGLAKEFNQLVSGKSNEQLRSALTTLALYGEDSSRVDFARQCYLNGVYGNTKEILGW